MKRPVRDMAVAAVFVLAGTAACAPAVRHHEVEIARLAFAPAHLDLAPGDTVTWVNRDLVPHTVTAVDGDWDSGEVPAGGAFTHVITGSATVRYLCRFHPTMTGTLEVR